MEILIDTDILIEYLRGNGIIVKKFTDNYKNGKKFCFSPITKAEIIAGLRKGEEEITLNLFHLMECLKINDAIGYLAGEYMKKFKASHNVEIADAFIAACAKYYKTTFWTLNKKHYPMKDIEFFI